MEPGGVGGEPPLTEYHNASEIDKFVTRRSWRSKLAHPEMSHKVEGRSESVAAT